MNKNNTLILTSVIIVALILIVGASYYSSRLASPATTSTVAGYTTSIYTSTAAPTTTITVGIATVLLLRGNCTTNANGICSINTSINRLNNITNFRLVAHTLCNSNCTSTPVNSSAIVSITGANQTIYTQSYPLTNDSTGWGNGTVVQLNRNYTNLSVSVKAIVFNNSPLVGVPIEVIAESNPCKGCG